MKILAAAITDTVERFLHAGYISAHPRPADEYSILGDGEVYLQLDMVEALKLQGEVASASVLGDGGSSLAALFATADSTTIIVGAAALAAGTGLAMAGLPSPRRRRTLFLGAGAALLLSVAHVSCDVGSQSGNTDTDAKTLPPPWEDVELQEYADPTAATQAIQHGIIADAIINIPFSVEALEHLQLEVGLPTTNPSEGMAHALLTYGFDGWGREMRLSSRGDAYTVQSAGPDGSFDTTDDLELAVRRTNEEDWEYERYGVFLREDSDDLVLIFHRWTGELFEYANETKAQELTGNEVFDVLLEDDLHNNIDDLRSAYDATAEELDHDPIVLQVYQESGFIEQEGTGHALTWSLLDHDSTYGIDLLGCGDHCDPFEGDTHCDETRSILCILKANLPNPGIETSHSMGWTGGYVDISTPVQGWSLTDLATANAICAAELGAGWQMAEWHDGDGGAWSWWAYGEIQSDERFWTYIDDQPANCWN